jgi:hypothetical protein
LRSEAFREQNVHHLHVATATAVKVVTVLYVANSPEPCEETMFEDLEENSDKGEDEELG